MKIMYSFICYFTLNSLFIVNLHSQSTSVFDAAYFNRENTSPPIKIGKGFHMNDVYKQTRACFTSESSAANKLTPQQTGGKKTNLAIFYTKDAQEYKAFKKNGASGKVSFLNLFSFGGETLEEFSSHTSESEERLIFTAMVDFGIFSFDHEPVLTPEAKGLIEQNKLQDFVKMYGTHYISGIKKESGITVVLKRISSESSDLFNTETSVEAGLGIPLQGKGSFKISDHSKTNDFLKSNKFSIEIAINGPTINVNNIQSDIEAILGGLEQDKVSAISRIISSAVGNISDPNQSLITQYYYSPFSLYGLDGIFWDEKKQNQLTKLNEYVISTYTTKSEMEDLISPNTKEEIRQELINMGYTDEYISPIISKYNEIVPALRSLSDSASRQLKDLEQKYIQCSDVYCENNSACCSIDQYLSRLYAYNIEEKFNIEFDKLIKAYEESSKEFSRPECEKKNLGIITIISRSSNPYYIYINGNYIATISGKGNEHYFVNTGTHSVKAVQKSGYLMYPTENLRTANITKVCDEAILYIGFED